MRPAHRFQHPLRGPQWTEAALRPHRRHYRSRPDSGHRSRCHVLHQVTAAISVIASTNACVGSI